MHHYDLAELRRYHEQQAQPVDDGPADDGKVYEALEFSGAEWKQIRDAAESEGIRVPAMIRRFIAEGLDRQEG